MENDAQILFTKLNRLEKRRVKLDEQINETRLEMIECCPHDDSRSVESYISGSYYDKEEYITSIYCKLCGTLLDEKIKYGGFG